MTKVSRYIFSASADAHRQITELFDFMHPTTIALWNLRWQVRGFVESHPGIAQSDIDARFARGINVNSGAIKKVCIDMPWDAQLENFSAIILVNCISIYEDFCSQISKLVTDDDRMARALEKKFQYPPSNYLTRGRSIFQSIGQRSSVLSGGVVWSDSILKRYHPEKIEGLFHCYRHFKELRNSFSHNGRRATELAVHSYQEFSDIISSGGMSGINIPEHFPVNLKNDPLKISYRGVIGFTEIVMMIITFFEVELSKFAIVEKELRVRLKPDSETWPTDEKRVSRRIDRLLKAAGLPSVGQSDQLRGFLRDEGLIPRYVKNRQL